MNKEKCFIREREINKAGNKRKGRGGMETSENDMKVYEGRKVLYYREIKKEMGERRQER